MQPAWRMQLSSARRGPEPSIGVPVPMLSPTIPQGAANSTCFRKLARFYAKDVQLMFPTLYNEWGGDEAAPAAAAAATREQRWRRSLLLID